MIALSLLASAAGLMVAGAQPRRIALFGIGRPAAVVLAVLLVGPALVAAYPPFAAASAPAPPITS